MKNQLKMDQITIDHKLINCNCGACFMRVSWFVDEEDWGLTLEPAMAADGFRDRIRVAWRVLTKGFPWVWGIILDRQECANLIVTMQRWLRLSREREAQKVIAQEEWKQHSNMLYFVSGFKGDGTR